MGVVRGERSRTSLNLFDEWGKSLRFPEWFGRNWDAFVESLEELVEREQNPEDAEAERQKPGFVLIIIVRSAQILQDEPERLETLVEFTRSTALGLAWDEKDRPRLAELRVLFQCEQNEAESLKACLANAGLRL